MRLSDMQRQVQFWCSCKAFLFAHVYHDLHYARHSSPGCLSAAIPRLCSLDYNWHSTALPPDALQQCTREQVTSQTLVDQSCEAISFSARATEICKRMLAGQVRLPPEELRSLELAHHGHDMRLGAPVPKQSWRKHQNKHAGTYLLQPH